MGFQEAQSIQNRKNRQYIGFVAKSGLTLQLTQETIHQLQGLLAKPQRNPLHAKKS